MATPDKSGRLPGENDFDRSVGFVSLIFGLGFVICAIASGFATFVGIHLFLDEAGGGSSLVNGTSVILTIAVVTILTIGWTFICRYGPEVRSTALKGVMVLLGVALFAMTVSVSSLPNLMAIIGPPAKVRDWLRSQIEYTVLVNDLADRSLFVAQLLPLWMAENGRACPLAEGEMNGGLASGLGGGVGPVAVTLSGICNQTGSFIDSIETAVADVESGVEQARAALSDMRVAIRDRDAPVVDREARFLEAGDALNAAAQQIRNADLLATLEAGAQQVRQSITELQADSSYSPRQIEMVSGFRESLNGLVTATEAVSQRLGTGGALQFPPVESPDYLEAIGTYWLHYLPGFAAAIGIDCFQIWALFFLLASKGGRGRRPSDG